MSETAIHLGDTDGEGYRLTIVRGFEDGTERYTTTFAKYICHGVTDVDITDPWKIGGGKCSQVVVHFSTGEKVNLLGVIKEIETNE